MAKAEAFHDPEAKRMMRQIAATYEEVARRLEREAGLAERLNGGCRNGGGKGQTDTVPLLRTITSRTGLIAIALGGGWITRHRLPRLSPALCLLP